MKSSVRWLLFEYEGLELIILSKPFKTKKLAEKARQKYPEGRVKDRNWYGSCADPVSEALLYTLGAEHAPPSTTAEPLF
jgi:hypothetical protein